MDQSVGWQSGEIKDIIRKISLGKPFSLTLMEGCLSPHLKPFKRWHISRGPLWEFWNVFSGVEDTENRCKSLLRQLNRQWPGSNSRQSRDGGRVWHLPSKRIRRLLPCGHWTALSAVVRAKGSAWVMLSYIPQGPSRGKKTSQNRLNVSRWTPRTWGKSLSLHEPPEENEWFICWCQENQRRVQWPPKVHERALWRQESPSRPRDHTVS